MANLTQLRMLEGVNGYLLVDKPAGFAFSTVVKTVKRKFNLVKVGHGGSLDAMASGLMVLLVGDANRFVNDVMGADRAYEGSIRLGLKTTTLDVHGDKLAENGAPGVTAEALAQAMAGFKGDVFQVEPRFCSVRREGSAAYEVADTGEHSQFLAHVYRFVATGMELPDVAFELVCTKALLPRALAGDLGEALGVGATLTALRRTRVGRFSLDRAIPFERLLETEMGDFASCVLPLSAALP